MERPPNIVNAEDVSHQELGEGCMVARDRDLGRAAGSERIGLVSVTVPAGNQSAPEHAHMAEEEIFYLLRGKGTLLQNGQSIPIEVGDVISYPPGTGISHALLADRGEELEFLVFDERNPNEAVVYPRSGKVGICSLGFLGYLGEKADYFDGEPT